MSLLRRTIAYILTLLVLYTLVLGTVVSVNAGAANSGEYSFSVSVDTDALIEYLEEMLSSCPKRVDVSHFGIPYTTADGISLQKLIWRGTPLLFHVNGIGLSGSNGIIEYVYFTYHYDAQTYTRMLNECDAAAQRMVGDLISSRLDDITKALIIHDRIIVNCEYDLAGVNSGNISNESQEMYGVLVNGMGNCQGYAFAYMYLLSKVGIKSYICSSEDMFHDWNIVIINGKKYHVDVTFDDPVQDVTGRVYHDYFMLSTKALKSAEHNFNDYDTSPSDTTYDNYYWKNSRAEFVVVNGNVYYIDNMNDTLNRLDHSGSLAKISDVWLTAEGNYWKGNYARLSTDGNNLFYSKSDAIYLYDLSSGKTREVCKPQLSGEAKSIYGFTYDEGYLIIDRYNKPNFDEYTKSRYQLKVPYDTEKPDAYLSYTNMTAAYQTVTLYMSDNNGISGYYWGKDAISTGNDFTYTNLNTSTVYVSEAGTYYLTAVDTAGNLSDTVSVVFYSTRLETDNGKVDTPAVITAKGESFVLPSAQRDGYEFIGWSRTYTDAGEYFETYTPATNGVLYALWNYTGNEENNTNVENYNNRFDDVSKSAWYADAVAYCAVKGYINGVSDTKFSPNTQLTREQFVVILANMTGVDANSYKYADSGMKDVPIGQWYSGAIAWGVAEGYVKGVAEDRFGLRQNITREQLARLFYVYAEDKGVDVEGRADLSVYKDGGKVSDWAADAVKWAVSSGIISGMSADTLGPRGNATRAQAARMFMIFDNLKKND